MTTSLVACRFVSIFELIFIFITGPYAWLFGFYHTQFVGSTVQNSGGRNQLSPHNQAIHAMKHGRRKDDCDKVEQWPDKDRYDQKMVIGCGTIDRPSPGHEPNGIDFDRGGYVMCGVHGCIADNVRELLNYSRIVLCNLFYP